MFSFKDFLSGNFTSNRSDDTVEDKFNRLKFYLDKYYGIQYSIKKIKFVEITAQQMEKYRLGNINISNNENFVMLAGFTSNGEYFIFDIDESNNSIIPHLIIYSNKIYHPLQSMSQINSFFNKYNIERVYALYQKPLSHHIIKSTFEN